MNYAGDGATYRVDYDLTPETVLAGAGGLLIAIVMIVGTGMRPGTSGLEPYESPCF